LYYHKIKIIDNQYYRVNGIGMPSVKFLSANI